MKRHLLITLLLTMLLSIGQTRLALSQKSTKRTNKNVPSKKTVTPVNNAPQTYRSQNFIVRTDLPKAEAEDLLKRLETMLKIISGYWGARNRQTIKCFVIKDIKNWSNEALDPRGIQHVSGGGGVTMSQVAFRGNRVTSAKAIVYASAIRNTPQHEAVHAYCVQTFGRTGPVWYSEGMAEMGQYWKKVPKKGEPMVVNCDDYVLNYIRKSEPKSLRDIVDRNEKTGDSWQAYSWRWALCHLLASNPNYSPRFHSLGLGLLNKKNVSFEGTYGAMADEISFEYKFFLQHLDKDYRVDLCSWDWKAKFKKLKTKRSGKSKIKAQQGWQPSKVLVESGKEYQFTAKGNWKIKQGGDDLTADGNSEKNGKLMGVIFKDFKLGEPFELGAEGTFTPTEDGKLFLRCKDKWNELADNTGKMAVTIKVK